MSREISKVTGAFLLGALSFYKRAISPWLGEHCRFYPSCSCYAKQAIEKWGPLRGLYFSVKRILHCHPFSPGGFDPVP